MELTKESFIQRDSLTLLEFELKSNLYKHVKLITTRMPLRVTSWWSNRLENIKIKNSRLKPQICSEELSLSLSARVSLILCQEISAESSCLSSFLQREKLTRIPTTWRTTMVRGDRRGCTHLEQNHKRQDVGGFVGVTVDTVQQMIKTALVV